MSDPNCGSVIGIDEVGRGALAGPVLACSVFVNQDKILDTFWEGVTDSKALLRKKRETIYKKFVVLKEDFKEHITWGIGFASVCEIDAHNILRATFLAMERSFHNLFQKNMSQNMPQDMVTWGVPNSFPLDSVSCPIGVFVDGKTSPPFLKAKSHLSVKAIIKGDQKVRAIALASIVAKVERDAIMMNLHKENCSYGWDHNVGYGTKKHVGALLTHGVSSHHRKSFEPIKSIV